MQGAMVITWGSAVPGREAKGLEVFGKALAYFEGLAKQGRVHGHKEFIALTGNQSRVGGCMIVEGQVEELLKIQTEEATLRLLQEAELIANNFSIQLFRGGSDQSIQQAVTQYMETLRDFGLA